VQQKQSKALRMFYCYAHEEDKKLLESKKIVDPKRKGFYEL
jgi:hypothetical protein